MSSSSTKDTAALQSTRQLLDELDTLMERMLALPIEDGEATPASPQPPAVAATLTLLDEPAPADASEMSMSQDPRQADHGPLADEMDTASRYLAAIEASTAPTYSEPVEPVDPVTPLNEVGVPALEKLISLPRLAPKPALGYQFLLWINRGYDHGTLWLGRPGQWLRTRLFRQLVGVAGLLLIALAMGWLASDWLGR